MATPKITLYTNHRCPWAHRAHIALKELNLPFEEVIIDLSKPREPWYLKINPRGLVPALSYNDNIITESAVVAQFLADAHPSHLLPSSGTEEGALQRARIAFFADTFFTKVLPHVNAGYRAATGGEIAERDAAAEELVGAVAKELEPLFPEDYASRGPFLGGSEKLTLAEVLTGSFVLRLHAFSKPEHGLLSSNLPTLLDKVPKFKRWIDAVVKENSVNYIWDEAAVAEGTKKRYEKLRAEGKL